MGFGILVAVAIPAVLILMGIRVLAEYERGVLFRFGATRG
jgi:regulator of protease activity HflC (stomatin/prohibitin superfamily)